MRIRTVFAVTVMAAMMPLAACSDGSADKVASERDSQGTESLAQAIKSDGDLSVLAGAINSADLATVFDGKAEYTMLAPSDDAFGKLGDAQGELSKPEHKAALAALLREHILPGTISPEDIAKSLAAANGKSISMATMGSGAVTFSKQGDKIIVTSPDGQQASLSPAIRARNGVIIPVDSLLKQWTGAT